MYRLGATKLGSNLHRQEAIKRSFRCFSSATGSCSTPTSDHVGKTPLSDDPQQYDVAIVGGGMVGMALACSLASNPLTEKLKVAIIDGSPALHNGISIKDNEPPDPRVSAITPASIALLKDVGAWRIVEQHRHAYFSKMQVWDYTGLGYTRYNAKDANKEILGCVVENKLLHSSLLSCLQESYIQKTLLNSRLTSMTLPSSASNSATSSYNQLAKLELDDGSTVAAKLVVGADGGKSRVRQLAGFDTTGYNYRQNALICTVEHSEQNFCAWQRFLPNGPIALLPMGDNYSNIVWSMSPEESSDRKTMNNDDFVKAVNHALDYGYPHPESNARGNDLFSFLTSAAVSPNEPFELPPRVMNLISERMVFPLSFQHSKIYASNRVVLVGDAAHTVHPLAGQGVNLGFGDASALARVIAEGIALGADYGEVSCLGKYEADRRPVNIMMASVLDGFQKAYSVDFGPLNVLRAAALRGAHHLSPLKRNIILYASGEMRLPFLS